MLYSSVAGSAKKHFSAKEIVLVALFSVLIAVCSWISVPMQVPFTLQTFAVFCTLELLGGRKGFFAVLVYIVLGATGVPVFSGFAGGMGVLLGMTGGYILGFLLQAAVYWAAQRFLPDRLVIRITALVIGLLLCYAFGTAWFIIVYTRTKAAIDLATALSRCVIPFLIPDLLKLTAALLLTARLRKSLQTVRS